MADVDVTVRSNVDALSARVIHEALVSTVDVSMKSAEDFLRADRAAHTRASGGGKTVDHIHLEPTSGLGAMVEAALGITPVTEKDAGRPTFGRYRHSQAPIFTDQGTRSPIFSARGGLMENKSEGIFHRREVKGQRGQHFMAKTFAELQAAIRADPQLSVALDTMAAQAAAEIPEVER